MLKQISTTCAARPGNPADLNDIDLTALVELAHRGEERAISLLYHHFAPQLARMAVLQGLDQPDGLASEVLARSFARLPMMEHVRIETFRAYIFRACRNAIANEHRRRSSQPTTVLVGDDCEKRDPESTTSDPEAVATSGAWFQDVVSNLTEQQRQVVELRFMDNLTLSETAETLGADVVAVKSTQRRALKALRTLLLAAGGAAAMVWLVVTGIQLEASAPRMINTTSISEGEGSTAENQQDPMANQQDPMALRVDQQSVDDPRQDAFVLTPAADVLGEVVPPVVVGTDTRSANREGTGDPGRSDAAEVDVIDVSGTGRSVDSERSEPEPGAEATPVWVVGSAIELSVDSGPPESVVAPSPDQAQTVPESFAIEQAETAGRMAGEAEAARVAAEAQAEASRIAAEAQASRVAGEAEASRVAGEAQAEASRIAAEAEAEASRIAAEAEASRVAGEAEAARVVAEAEASRIAAEAEALRIAGEAEALRIAAEAEAARVAAEAEAARVAAEAQAARVAAEAEAEAARVAVESEAARIAGEAARIAAEAGAARVAGEAEAARIAAEAGAARVAGEAEAARIAGESARIAAEAEAERIAAEAARIGADQVRGSYRPSLGCATTCRTDLWSGS